MVKGKVILVLFPFDDLTRELGKLSAQMRDEVNKKLQKLFEW